MTDPLRAHAAAQPGIATYPGMLGTPPIRPWTALHARPAPTRIVPTAQTAAETTAAPGEGERTHGAAQTLTAGHSVTQTVAHHATAAGPDDPAGSQPAASCSQPGSNGGAVTPPERTCPAGHTGPLPEMPPEYYGPDPVPLEPVSYADQLTTRHGQPMADALDRARRRYEASYRPRPAPRPPWWRRALHQIRGTQ